MGHREWGIGNGASGMGHWALGMYSRLCRGTRSTVNSQQLTVNSQQSTVNSQQSTDF
ncbi:hypothetical protein QUB13_06990 [Microcoleus sp. B4-D4]